MRSQLTLFGEAQSHYALEKSSNLVNWISLTNFTATNSAMPLTDASPDPSAPRFYRAVSIP